MQDLSLIAEGRAPRFRTPPVDITPDHAASLLANATAATEAQLIVTGVDGAREGLASITDFVNSGGSLEGLEPTFFSYGVSLANEPDAEQLLDEAAIALLRAEGSRASSTLRNTLCVGDSDWTTSSPSSTSSAANSASRRSQTSCTRLRGRGDFTHPGAIAADPVAALEAVSSVVKAPGHRLFTAVEHAAYDLARALGGVPRFPAQ